MIKLSTSQIKELQTGEKSTSEVAISLLQSYSAVDIALAFVELAICTENSNVPQIPITEEQLKLFFKVKDPNEKRGRPKKEKED